MGIFHNKRGEALHNTQANHFIFSNQDSKYLMLFNKLPFDDYAQKPYSLR